jgi:hypothetical protein
VKPRQLQTLARFRFSAVRLYYDDAPSGIYNNIELLSLMRHRPALRHAVRVWFQTMPRTCSDCGNAFAERDNPPGWVVTGSDVAGLCATCCQASDALDALWRGKS